MVERIRLTIARDQLEQALCEVERTRGALVEELPGIRLGDYWRAQDRVWFWNLAARVLTKNR